VLKISAFFTGNITQKSFPEMRDELKIHTAPILIHLFNRAKYISLQKEKIQLLCVRNLIYKVRGVHKNGKYGREVFIALQMQS